MTEDAFGWAIINAGGHIMLPVQSTRSVVIAEFVGSMDDRLSPRLMDGALDPDQAAAWRRMKRRYSMRAIRVRITPAQGAQP